MNNPDKIIFVGEALVGNEAVDQLTKFDRALRDFSASSGGKERGIDGMLVTKWDTVDDKVRVPAIDRPPASAPGVCKPPIRPLTYLCCVPAGGRGAVDDLRDRPADHLRWLRPGVSVSVCPPEGSS